MNEPTRGQIQSKQTDDIADDDSELEPILRRLPLIQYPVLQFFKLVSIGVTRGYEEINAGRLRTHHLGSRRMVDALDGAKWLLARKREAATGARRRVGIAAEPPTEAPPASRRSPPSSRARLRTRRRAQQRDGAQRES